MIKIMNIDIKKIQQAIVSAKRKIAIILIVAAIIILCLFLVIGKGVIPRLSDNGVFYYKVEGKDAKLFSLESGDNPKHLTTIPAEEIGVDDYRVPKHTYVSESGNVLIYFERTEEIPLGTMGENDEYTAYRIMYQPKHVDLKSGEVKEIKQDIDSGSLVFSPDENKIAWVSLVQESTVGELEQAGVQREVWLSNSDGTDAKQLVILDDKVVLIQRWEGNYIYFWGIKGVGYYTLGRINTKSGKVQYVRPKYCLEDLTNCQNFSFSPSGRLFIYEAGFNQENNENVEIFAESFTGGESWKILVANYVSERIWMPDNKSIIYTEQTTERKIGVRETIHLANLETGEDTEIYTGSYISQIFPDSSGRYLYFIEKESDEKFNLVKLEIKSGKADIIDSGEYYHLKLFSFNSI